jgi:hypothetical protein
VISRLARLTWLKSCYHTTRGQMDSRKESRQRNDINPSKSR